MTNYQQLPATIQPQSSPAVFRGAMFPVKQRQRFRILENRRGVFKADAVFVDIRGRFPYVPLKIIFKRRHAVRLIVHVYFFKNAENKSIGSGRNVVVLCSLAISRMV